VPLPADSTNLASVERKPPERFRVAAAGWWCEKKGFDVAIKAFAGALRGRDAELLLMGGGPLGDDLRRLVADEGIENQVVWRGLTPFKDFMSEIGTCSLALFPSRRAANGDSDGGAPVTLIETQWLGVPVIVSRHDDLPFVAAHEGAIVLGPLDVDGWADAIRQLYEDPARLARMGELARGFAREHHSPEANAVGREAVYALARSGSQP
jgi:colanic acid/amylovoran biosynthesis glycosyltransferase